MEVGLRTKYMFMSINKLQNKVTTYRLAINYLRIWQSPGMTLTVHNYMREEIKSRLILGTTHCHLVKNNLSSHFLPNNVRIEI